MTLNSPGETSVIAHCIIAVKGIHPNVPFGRVCLGVVIRVGGLCSCRIKLRLYDNMGQPKHNPFINCVEAGQPVLTQNMIK